MTVVNPAAEILSLQNVTRCYADRRAIDSASLRLCGGEAVCLIGGNGAGKSTLLGLAAGILTPDEGRVIICGEALAGSRKTRRHIGWMGDAPLLYDALTARENLAFFARLYGLRQPAARIDQLLQRVGLIDRARDAAGALSAGMRRRLDLARAILHEPALLLLDEPMNSLDAEGRQLVSLLIDESAGAGRAVLWTAHQLVAEMPRADRLLHLAAGRLHDEPVPGAPARGESADCATHQQEDRH